MAQDPGFQGAPKASAGPLQQKLRGTGTQRTLVEAGEGPNGYLSKKVQLCGKSSSVESMWANAEEPRQSQRGKRRVWAEGPARVAEPLL